MNVYKSPHTKRQTMLDQKIEKYTHDHSSPEDPILSELNRETHLKVLNPRMISGHPQGKLLEIISKMHQPEKILEIGTFSGYSAICLAKGLKAGGELHTIEMNDELTSIQDKYFSHGGDNGSTRCDTGVLDIETIKCTLVFGIK